MSSTSNIRVNTLTNNHSVGNRNKRNMNKHMISKNNNNMRPTNPMNSSNMRNNVRKNNHTNNRQGAAPAGRINQRQQQHQRTRPLVNNNNHTHTPLGSEGQPHSRSQVIAPDVELVIPRKEEPDLIQQAIIDNLINQGHPRRNRNKNKNNNNNNNRNRQSGHNRSTQPGGYCNAGGINNAERGSTAPWWALHQNQRAGMPVPQSNDKDSIFEELLEGMRRNQRRNDEDVTMSDVAPECWFVAVDFDGGVEMMDVE